MRSDQTIRCNKDGKIHHHATFAELISCIGSRAFDVMALVQSAPATAPVTSPVRPVSGAPVGSGTPRPPTAATDEVKVVHKEAGPTVPQLGLISKRGGSWRDAFDGNRAEASAIIGALEVEETAEGWMLPEGHISLDDDAWEMFPRERAWRRGQLPSEWRGFRAGGENGAAQLQEPEAPTPVANPWEDDPSYAAKVSPPEPPYKPKAAATAANMAKPAAPSSKDRIKLILPLVEKVREGYYATELGNGLHNDLKFFRLSRPKTGNYAGQTKIQWQLADNWQISLIIRENGSFWLPTNLTFSMVDYLTNIVVDATGCARRYAKEIDKCCRCNTSLTDERSRHYGIGPECEKHWPHIIQLVDEEDELRREEEAKKW